MHTDEERLYDPNEETDLAQNIDASSTSGTPNNENNSNSLPSSPGNEDGQEVVVKHRWFILEPAVFLVFLAMYLSGKRSKYTTVDICTF